jgi:hypothetical protein
VFDRPGLIAGTWHRPLFLTRDRWFESGSLHAESVANLTFGGHFVGEPKVGIQPAKLLRQRTRRGQLDEMVVPFARKRVYLSRAVDHEGEILDISAH